MLDTIDATEEKIVTLRPTQHLAPPEVTLKEKLQNLKKIEKTK